MFCPPPPAYTLDVFSESKLSDVNVERVTQPAGWGQFVSGKIKATRNLYQTLGIITMVVYGVFGKTEKISRQLLTRFVEKNVIVQFLHRNFLSLTLYYSLQRSFYRP